MKLQRCAVLMGAIVLPSLVHGDLYTGYVSSIEWKVESADVIVVVKALKRDGVHDQHLEWMKAIGEVVYPGAPLSSEVKRAVGEWRPPPYSKSGQEWLLFVRRWEKKDPTIDHVVNLSIPLKASSVSAVTAGGVPLRNRASVMKAVADRLKRKRPMATAVRESRAEVDKGPQQDYWHRYRFGEVEDVAPFLGGFFKRVDCEFWDSPNSLADDPVGDEPHDESLWITHVVVPADQVYKDKILRALQEGSPDSPTNREEFPLGALVNYPGKETEKALEAFINRNPAIERRVGRFLRYLKFHPTVPDPRQQQILGHWQIQGSGETINIEFLEGNTFRAHGRPKPIPGPNKHRRQWWGSGAWVIANDKLTIVRRTFRFTDDARRGLRPILGDKPILEINDKEIRLEGGPKIVKRDGKELNQD